MHNYIYVCCLENVYHHYLYPHTGAVRTAVVEGMALVGHYLLNNKGTQFPPGNFNASQCEHSMLSVPTSVVLKKLCGW